LFKAKSINKIDVFTLSCDGGLRNTKIVFVIDGVNENNEEGEHSIQVPVFYEPYIIFELIKFSDKMQYDLTKVFLMNLIL